MNNSGNLSAVRREYHSARFDRADLAPYPHQQFGRWLEQHSELDPANATAMVLATANESGQPSARIVLLKHFDAEGFCWYTDYRSAKGQQLADNPQAELLFYWPELDRQVRINGTVEKLSREAAERYFTERPRGSQLSAAASHQSHRVAGRSELEAQVRQLEQSLNQSDVPCPSYWGGYRLCPRRFEFWQGRENRLHDRLVYQIDDNEWRIERLAP